MYKKISIVIPVYNVEKYLERCIESILKNDNIENCEIILVDDGSTDNSANICKKYLKEYSNIQYFLKENGGASDARNYGIQKATGEYIWFIDSDDSIEPNSIKEFLKIIDSEKPEVMICQSKIVDNNNIYDECIYSIKTGLYSSEDFMTELKNNPKSVMFSPQYYIVKRDFLLKNHLFFYKGIIYEDELWIPQLLLKAKRIYYTNCNIYYHYMINTSVMHATKLEKMRKK